VVSGSGDEIQLGFEPGAAVPAGWVRDFVLYSVGWDKDADYHVAAGTSIEPLPWSGMDDQLHGIQPRPAFPSDALHQEFNTRWVGPRAIARKP
jgi:hypothetical protein